MPALPEPILYDASLADVTLPEINTWLSPHPVSYMVFGLLSLALLAWVANWITRHVLLRGLRRLVKVALPDKDPELSPLRVTSRLANIVPALVLSAGIGLIPDVPVTALTVVRNVSSAFIVLTIALAIGSALDLGNALYQRRPDADQRPIKGYVQILKIVIYAVAAILVVASLIDRSPLILLSGLGAMAAVLMLIFQDTLLSLVASVQLGTNDMVRLGDWIEVPQQNTDGAVIDIALHTVKVRNWDNTITSVPTKKLISDAFKNWRGMSESGGRRIKRSLLLDQQSIHFLSGEERAHLARFALLQDYFVAKADELAAWNARHPGTQSAINQRRLTNIGTFRMYVLHYLRAHPEIHQGMSLMVRQLAPTPDGLPLELYCFTSDTRWAEHERIQSDIFDHLFAILPEFGLRVFQQPSGADMQAMGSRLDVVRRGVL